MIWRSSGVKTRLYRLVDELNSQQEADHLTDLIPQHQVSIVPCSVVQVRATPLQYGTGYWSPDQVPRTSQESLDELDHYEGTLCGTQCRRSQKKVHHHSQYPGQQTCWGSTHASRCHSMEGTRLM
ncbi:unnamed protein product [Pleuronectes platessa]|uniref:Uncharacterized protein n=1 Tax=Pleuronectes platessa TaxID=8262 RepID=A0A9N7UFY4_PLEPL|nr:unnamed protein product [Pleuronectes platessa]